MSSTIQALSGLVACVAWLLTFFELKRIFNRPNAGRLFKSELVQMLTAVLLVTLVCLAIAILTTGLVSLLPFGQGAFGIIGAFVIAVVTFIALFVVIGAMFSPLTAGRDGAEHLPK